MVDEEEGDETADGEEIGALADPEARGKEHIDFDVVKSANAEFKGATVRINIYKHRRQTVQYILPHEHEKLSQAELLVVDEAAGVVDSAWPRSLNRLAEVLRTLQEAF
ncbi:hypothetical protein RIF29_25839 [Crotalaria pallida]|uniref:TcmA/NAT10 helicase domain-containing protein n=1 Tax=Crotalaria pallida TaxID=3830 RepID=A0AAN9EUC1_CROPI